MLNRHAQAGFTLVEVMVTVFVVAIGLLTAAGLQAVSKKAAFDALQRSTATILAQDMIERIRSNPLEANRYASLGTVISAAPPAATCGSGTACSSGDLVGYDLARWWEALDGASEQIADGNGGTSSSGGLRSPVGCIRNTGNLVEVVIAWRGMSLITQGDAATLEDPTNDTCGENTAAFEKSGSQSFRRVLRVQAHIENPPA